MVRLSEHGAEAVKRERSAEEADVLRDTCPRTPGPDLSRPLWRTLHRAAGDRDDAALGDAAGSGRAAWSAPTDHPSRSDPALTSNERGAERVRARSLTESLGYVEA